METTPETTGGIPDAQRKWGEVIAAARERGYFTEEERERSRDWFSCACGRLDPRIPRDKEQGGAPKDGPLFFLGFGFCSAVHENAFVRTETLLGSIEAREAELLAELAMNASEDDLSQAGEPSVQPEPEGN